MGLLRFCALSIVPSPANSPAEIALGHIPPAAPLPLSFCVHSIQGSQE